MATQIIPQNSESQVNTQNKLQRVYVIGKKIGQGTHATVHLAKFIDGTNTKKGEQRLACKIFNKKKSADYFLNTFFPRELEILTKIENPHIIEVHSILQRGPEVFIFMQYAENGDLLEYILAKGPIPEQLSKLWFRQMASGLQYLHKINIAHRDLKCENILLSRKYDVKLADFGFARYCTNEQGQRVLSQTYCGSAAYAAPEIVASIPYNPKLADVWSLGVILFIMLNADMPFKESTLPRILKDQTSKNWSFNPKIRDQVSSLAKTIVRQILEPDITLRLTVDRCLAHDWLRSKRDKNNFYPAKLVHSAPPIPNQKNEPEIGTASFGAGHTGFHSKNQQPLSVRLGLKSFKTSHHGSRH